VFATTILNGPQKSKEITKGDLSCALSGFPVVAALELFDHFNRQTANVAILIAKRLSAGTDC
jgi:hypothetical protein